MKIGMNVGGPSYYTAERPLIDAFPLSFTKSTSVDPATNLPIGDGKEVVIAVPVDLGLHNYTYLIDGPVTKIRHVGGPTVAPNGQGEVALDLHVESGSVPDVQIKITAAGPVESIHLVRTDHLAAFRSGERFNPDYVKALSNFDPIRFLDFNVTNATDLPKRPRATDQLFSSTSGFPAAFAGELCSKLGARPWYPIHHLMDDDRVLDTLHELDQALPPNRPVTLEWSNEIPWNYHKSWAFAEARKLFPMVTGTDGKARDSVPFVGLRWYARRAGQLALLARRVSPRFKVGLSDQFGMGHDHVPVMLQGWDESAAPRGLIDGWYTAPYISAPDIDQLLVMLRANDTAAVLGYFKARMERNKPILEAHAARVKPHGIPLKVYEVNQRTTSSAPIIKDDAVRAFFVEKMRPILHSKPMAEIIMANIDNAEAAGFVEAVFFELAGYGSKSGFWGAMEHVSEPIGYPIFQMLKARAKASGASPNVMVR